MAIAESAAVSDEDFREILAQTRQFVRTAVVPREQEFLDEDRVPDDLDVHIVLDNSSTHKTPTIRRWLVRHPRFTFHFTPTYSSWLNLVERWFGELTTKKLQRGTHRSVRELNTDIRGWIKTWNDNPRPYVWTKTADQILDSIAKHCTRINDSGH